MFKLPLNKTILNLENPNQPIQYWTQGKCASLQGFSILCHWYSFVGRNGEKESRKSKIKNILILFQIEKVFNNSFRFIQTHMLISYTHYLSWYFLCTSGPIFLMAFLTKKGLFFVPFPISRKTFCLFAKSYLKF